MNHSAIPTLSRSHEFRSRNSHLTLCYQSLDPSLHDQLPDQATHSFMEAHHSKHGKYPDLHEIILKAYGDQRQWIDQHFPTTPWNHLKGSFQHVLCTLKMPPTPETIFATISFMGRNAYRYPTHDELIRFSQDFLTMEHVAQPPQIKHPVSQQTFDRLEADCTSKVKPADAILSEICTLCINPFKIGDTFVSLPCGHHFHFPSNAVEPKGTSKQEPECSLSSWIRSNESCPNCRANISMRMGDI